MTVAELKALLADMADDMKVYVPAIDYGRDGLVECSLSKYTMGEPAFVVIHPTR